MEITNFAELGSLIRDAREASGASLEDVAARIKVSARILSAIENGNQKALPHAVYSKAFVRSYGQALGLDAQELSIALDKIFTEESLGNIHPELGTIAREKAMNPRNTLLTVAIAVAIIAILAGLCVGGWVVVDLYGNDIWNFVKKPFSASSSVQIDHTVLSKNGSNAGQATTNQADITDKIYTDKAAESTPSEAGINRSVSVNAQSQGAPPEGQMISNHQVAPGGSATQPGENPGSAVSGAAKPFSSGGQAASPTNNQVATSSTNSTNSSSMSTTQPLAATSTAHASEQSDGTALAENGNTSILAGFNSIVLEGAPSHECWVGAAADGEREQGFMLKPNGKVALSFKKNVRLRLGLPGGVKMWHNGKPYEIPGRPDIPTSFTVTAKN